MQYTKNEIMQAVTDGNILDDFPRCNGDDVLKDVLDKMNLKGLGFCVIHSNVIGIITDGDIRRQIAKGNMPLYALLSRPVKELGTFPCSSVGIPFNLSETIQITLQGKTYIPIIENSIKCEYVINFM